MALRSAPKTHRHSRDTALYPQPTLHPESADLTRRPEHRVVCGHTTAAARHPGVHKQQNHPADRLHTTQTGTVSNSMATARRSRDAEAELRRRPGRRTSRVRLRRSTRVRGARDDATGGFALMATLLATLMASWALQWVPPNSATFTVFSGTDAESSHPSPLRHLLLLNSCRGQGRAAGGAPTTSWSSHSRARISAAPRRAPGSRRRPRALRPG